MGDCSIGHASRFLSSGQLPKPFVWKIAALTRESDETLVGQTTLCGLAPVGGFQELEKTLTKPGGFFFKGTIFPRHF